MIRVCRRDKDTQREKEREREREGEREEEEEEQSQELITLISLLTRRVAYERMREMMRLEQLQPKVVPMFIIVAVTWI